MRSRNFIPACRIQARQRRRRASLWLAAGAAYALALLAGCFVCRGLWGGNSAALAEELSKADSAIQHRSRLMHQAGEELAATEQTLKAAEAIEGHPDFSALLTLLARCLDNETMLKQLQLQPDAPAQPATPGERRRSRFILRLAGFGRSQAAVSAFVLRLEKVGLFDQVKLIKTSREPFLADSAIGFQVECLMGGEGEPE